MQQYNILIGCDQKYYNDWGIQLLKSILHLNPWLNNCLHCHIVNPTNFDPLPNVVYTVEEREFHSDDSRIAYLQAVRFLKVADKIDKDNFFITLDTDTICTQPFSYKEFSKVFDKINVLLHRKSQHWLAGFVSFNSEIFAKEYADLLLELPVSEWKYGRDQDVLAALSKKYEFTSVDSNWMHYGKKSIDSVFYTLKGTDKVKNKYLDVYRKYTV